MAGFQVSTEALHRGSESSTADRSRESYRRSGLPTLGGNIAFRTVRAGAGRVPVKLCADVYAQGGQGRRLAYPHGQDEGFPTSPSMAERLRGRVTRWADRSCVVSRWRRRCLPRPLRTPACVSRVPSRRPALRSRGKSSTPTQPTTPTARAVLAIVNFGATGALAGTEYRYAVPSSVQNFGPSNVLQRSLSGMSGSGRIAALPCEGERPASHATPPKGMLGSSKSSQ
jgi:hypothetical protein